MLGTGRKKNALLQSVKVRLRMYARPLPPPCLLLRSMAIVKRNIQEFFPDIPSPRIFPPERKSDKSLARSFLARTQEAKRGGGEKSGSGKKSVK